MKPLISPLVFFFKDGSAENKQITDRQMKLASLYLDCLHA